MVAKLASPYLANLTDVANSMDGLGALIISPTRELAMQIFQVLRKIGVKHDLSAGLVIGGKDVAEEQVRSTCHHAVVALKPS